MKLSFKKMLFTTIAIILLDIIYLWIREHYGLMNWISPKTLKFWVKDIALLIAWIVYFIETKKKETDSN